MSRTNPQSGSSLALFKTPRINTEWAWSIGGIIIGRFHNDSTG